MPRSFLDLRTLLLHQSRRGNWNGKGLLLYRPLLYGIFGAVGIVWSLMGSASPHSWSALMLLPRLSFIFIHPYRGAVATSLGDFRLPFGAPPARGLSSSISPGALALSSGIRRVLAGAHKTDAASHLFADLYAAAWALEELALRWNHDTSVGIILEGDSGLAFGSWRPCQPTRHSFWRDVCSGDSSASRCRSSPRRPWLGDWRRWAAGCLPRLLV